MLDVNYVQVEVKLDLTKLLQFSGNNPYDNVMSKNFIIKLMEYAV